MRSLAVWGAPHHVHAGICLCIPLSRPILSRPVLSCLVLTRPDLLTCPLEFNPFACGVLTSTASEAERAASVAERARADALQAAR